MFSRIKDLMITVKTSIVNAYNSVVAKVKALFNKAPAEEESYSPTVTAICGMIFEADKEGTSAANEYIRDTAETFCTDGTRRAFQILDAIIKVDPEATNADFDEFRKTIAELALRVTNEGDAEMKEELSGVALGYPDLFNIDEETALQWAYPNK